jgi:hypothetical protein
MEEMGLFRTSVEIANPATRDDRRSISNVLVDTGAELSRFPRALLEDMGIAPVKLWHFRQADGSVLARWTGGAWLCCRNADARRSRLR